MPTRTRSILGRGLRGSVGQRVRLVVATFASNAGAQFFLVLSGPLLAYSLTVANRGYLAAAVAGTGVCTSFGSLGLPDAVSYAIASGDVCLACTRAASRQLLGLVVPPIAAAAAGVLVAEGVLSRAGWACVVAAAVAAGMGSASEVQRAVLVGERRYRTLNRERWLNAIVRLGGIAGLMAAGHLTLITSVLAAIVAPGVFSFGFLMVVASPPWHSCLTPPAAGRRRSLLSYGLRAWAGHVLGFTTARLDQLLIGPIVGAHALGLYAIAASYSELPAVLLLTARQFILPEQATSRSRDLSIVSRGMFTAAAAILIPATCVIAPWLIPLAFGHPYDGSVLLAVVLCLGIPGWMCSGVLGSMMEGRGRPGTVSLSSLAGVAVTLAGLPLLLPVIGAMGASIVTVLSAFASLLALLGPSARASGVRRRDLLFLRRSDIGLLQSLRDGDVADGTLVRG